jgi:predicted Ser/Thr protein kinase
MAIGPGINIGQYVVKQKIGEGGMGAVFLAEQPAIHRSVVLKVLTTGLAGNREMLDRFKREVDIIAQLEHPHILPVYDFGVYEGDPYIVMRYMGGGSLLDQLRSRALGRQALLAILDQVAEALDYAHARDIIHRDLKPGNILLDDSHNAYLADFGLAKTMEGSRDLTKTGSVLGTPAYMSPEQARGEPLDARSDVYSFAVMTFEALSGMLPFEGKTPMEYIRKHLSEPPRSIRTLARDLPSEVDGTMNRALSKDRQTRPARATVFMHELRASLEGRQAATATVLPGATMAAVPAAPARPARRRWALPALALGLGGLAVVAVAIAAGIFLVLRGPLAAPKVHTYQVGDSPRAILNVGDAVWVTNAFDNSLVALQAQGCQENQDPCGRALGTYPVDDLPIGLADLNGTVWVASALHRTLTPFDPTSNQAGQSVQLPSIPSALLAGEGFLWTANDIAGSITKVDPQSGTVTEYPTGQGTQALALIGNALWVANNKDSNVVEVDPASGEIRRTISLESGPASLAWDGTRLWVAMPEANAVAALDLQSGAALTSAHLAGRPVALAFDGQAMWAVTQQADELVRIAPDTATITQTVPLTGGPYALAWVDCGASCRDIWVVGESGDIVSRIRMK